MNDERDRLPNWASPVTMGAMLLCWALSEVLKKALEDFSAAFAPLIGLLFCTFTALGLFLLLLLLQWITDAECLQCSLSLGAPRYRLCLVLGRVAALTDWLADSEIWLDLGRWRSFDEAGDEISAFPQRNGKMSSSIILTAWLREVHPDFILLQ